MGKINVKKFGILHPYVFYHNDMDGKCSAWLLHDHFCQMHIDDSPSDYQHYNYDGNMKLGSINKSTVVYIVDLSFTESTDNILREICDKAAHVIWIDHHDSSIELLKQHPELLEIENLNVFVSNQACGALLTKFYLTEFLSYVHPLEDNYQRMNLLSDMCRDINWLEEFSINSITPATDNANAFVSYTIGYNSKTIYIDNYLEIIDDYDRRQNRNKNTRAFIAGTDMENTSIVYKMPDNKIVFNTAFWNTLDIAYMCYIDNGSIILRYRDKKASDELHQCFEWIEPETGAKIICKNDRGDSYVFLDLYNTYDAVCLFSYNGTAKRWFYSVYNERSKTFNCANFCRRFGGGGHIHAAGFNTEKLIFDI